MNPNSIIALSRKITHAYNKQCESLLNKYGIPQVSFDILMFLANNPEHSTAQEISEMRQIKKNLVSVHVEKLVNSGLLKRYTVAGDRRKIALSYTENALPIIQAGAELQKDFALTLIDGISDDKWTVLTEIHETLEANTDRILQS